MSLDSARDQRRTDGGAEVHRAHRVLDRLGLLNLCCFAIYAVLSWGIATGSHHQPHPHTTAVFEQWARSVAGTLPWLSHLLAGETWLHRARGIAFAAGLQLAIPSVLFIAALATLYRYRKSLDETTPRRLFRWSVLFAVVTLVATPVFAADFWNALPWARESLSGQNPYLMRVDAVAAQGIPTDDSSPAVYGPWVIQISAMFLVLSGNRALLVAVLSKLLLGGAWLGAIHTAARLQAPARLWHRAFAVLVLGWLPLGVSQYIAEGHNDIVLALLVLLWLRSHERGTGVLAPLYLCASVLVKFVTAALLPLEGLWLLRRWRPDPGRAWRYGAMVVAALVMTVLSVAPFWASGAMIARTSSMRTWHDLAPADVATAFRTVLSVDLGWLRRPIALVFPVAAAWLVLRFLLDPSDRRFRIAILAVLSAVVFWYVGHVWPWYLIWPLIIVVLEPDVLLSRWVLGLAVAAPFIPVGRRVFATVPTATWQAVATLGFYAASALWLLCIPRRWYPAPGGGGAVERV